MDRVVECMLDTQLYPGARHRQLCQNNSPGELYYQPCKMLMESWEKIVKSCNSSEIEACGYLKCRFLFKANPHM